MVHSPPATPFGPKVDHVHLEHDPLVLVISQIKFPPIVSILNESFIGGFQETLRSTYPVLRKTRQQGFVVKPNSDVEPAPGTTLWRFEQADSGPWVATLSQDFVALQTTKYSTGDEWFSRLEQLLYAVHQHFQPTSCDRLGLRYINHVLNPTPKHLVDLLRPEVLGVTAVRSGAQKAQLKHSVSDTVYSVGTSTFHSRWGLIPGGQTIDPTILPPDEDYWFLDLDMYLEKTTAFSVERLLVESKDFAERIHRYFQWVFSEKLTSEFGTMERP